MPPKTPDAGSAGAGADAAGAVDLWLECDLRRRYSGVAAEPVPRELLRLLGDVSEAAGPRAAGPPPRGGRARGTPGAGGGFERRVRERAYFLWLAEGRPEGRALEHWMLAFTRQVAQEAHDRHAG
jgi:hypothetical protein